MISPAGGLVGRYYVADRRTKRQVAIGVSGETILSQKSTCELREALVALILGPREYALDERPETLLAPVISRRAFRAPGIAGARSFEKRFSCGLIEAGIGAGRERVAFSRVTPA
jgi:hypothetical protein